MAITTEGTYQDFAYTGGVQSFTVPYDGLYKLECYGAQGGYSTGGKGGYSLGYAKLIKGSLIYICVGQAGTYVNTQGQTARSSYNGGGSSLAKYENWRSCSGGGATHMALVTGLLASIGYTKFVTNGKGLIVAGGGGGAGNSDGQSYSGGGSGGGISGGSPISGDGATQTSGYAFGQGGSSQNHGGAGGGGFYGGKANNNERGGGGGSGRIGGVPSITYKGTTYSPSTSNGVNSGNGKARITLVKKAFPTIIYNGVTLEGINFNGTEVDTVVFNGVTLE